MSYIYIHVIHLHTCHTYTYMSYIYIHVIHIHTCHTYTYRSYIYIHVTHIYIGRCVCICAMGKIWIQNREPQIQRIYEHEVILARDYFHGFSCPTFESRLLGLAGLLNQGTADTHGLLPNYDLD